MDKLIENLVSNYLSLSVIIVIIIILAVFLTLKDNYELDPDDPEKRNFYAAMVSTSIYLFVPIVCLVYLNNKIIGKDEHMKAEGNVIGALEQTIVTPESANIAPQAAQKPIQQVNQQINQQATQQATQQINQQATLQQNNTQPPETQTPPVISQSK